MILSDTAIFEALDDGRLSITPAPGPRQSTIDDPRRAYDATAVNLTLGQQIARPRLREGYILDPAFGRVAETINVLYETIEIPEDGFQLQPNTFVLAQTKERIELRLPSDLPSHVARRGCLAARVEGKSSLARLGLLVHFTAPTIHAGFAGHITLEMMNLGPAPIMLRAGMAICQLILEQVKGHPQAGPSQFQGQTAPTGAA